MGQRLENSYIIGERELVDVVFRRNYGRDVMMGGGGGIGFLKFSLPMLLLNVDFNLSLSLSVMFVHTQVLVVHASLNGTITLFYLGATANIPCIQHNFSITIGFINPKSSMSNTQISSCCWPIYKHYLPSTLKNPGTICHSF